MTTSTKKTTVKKVEEVVPIHPDSIFPLMMFQALKEKVIVNPNDPQYDPAKDRLRIGFKFGNTTIPAYMKDVRSVDEISSYDFLTSPKTGMRPHQMLKPTGGGHETISEGVRAYTHLPPILVWHNGQWLSDALFDPGFEADRLASFVEKWVEDSLLSWPDKGIPEKIFNVWLTSGEGTHGNYLYRTYSLPPEIASKGGVPPHPTNWPQNLQKTSSYKPWKTTTVQEPSTTIKIEKPSYPMGARLRCPMCGHWFTVDDMIAHSVLCDQDDIAIMCHADCGCNGRSLDDVKRPKEGFPRPKPVEEKKEEGKEE